MKTLAVLLILVAIATSQPHTWLSAIVDFLTHCIGR
jgi:hypothetical protein